MQRREQEQREEGIWPYRMDYLSTQKEKLTHPQHNTAKIQKTTGYLKHYHKKPLARKEERHLKVVG